MLLTYFAIFSCIVGLSFLYRRGYLMAIGKFKLKKLKSVKEYLYIVFVSLLDILGIFFGLVRKFFNFII